MRIMTGIICTFLSASVWGGVVEPAAPAGAASSSVTIPLTRFEELQKATESTSATVIDTMTLSGTFRDHNLTATFAGRSVGSRVATEIVADAPDLTLSGCKGEALLLRTGRGAYSLVALGPSFVLRCEARPSGSDRLRMDVASSILAVRSDVADGELVAGEEDGNGSRSYTLVRQVTGGRETLATTATGRYLITLLPDATRFRYVVQVHNPNRSTSPLQLQLVSGEHLQQIDSTATYEPKGESYVFAMPPADSTITLSGEMQGTAFTPPVEASLQYVVVESHPLLRPAMGAQAKRVSTAETGIDTQYKGALAFEIRAHDRISWTVTRLEAMRAISYSVRSADHTLFVPADGPVLGESSLSLENQGAPDLVLPSKPEPTFVSLQGEPVLMTKNTAGELSVPLSAGPQRIIVQHRQSIPQFGIVAAQLEVPRLPVAATYTNVSLRYPEHWLPLWQSFATHTTTWRPEAQSLLMLVFIAVWLERVLAYLAAGPRRRWIASPLLAFASMLVPALFWLVMFVCASVTVLWIVSQRSKVSLPRLVAIGGLSCLLVLVILVYSFSRRATPDYSSGSGGLASVMRNDEQVMTDTSVTATSAPAAAPKTAPAGTSRAGGSFAYQGLPAKFELPGGVRYASFSEQMLAPDRPQKITLVLISMTIVTWLAIALGLFGAWLVWRDRKMLGARLRLRFAEAMPPVVEKV